MSHIIPIHKDDQYAIQHLRAASEEQVLAVAKELVEWTEDYNWPVARPVCEALGPYVNQLQDYLLPILRGNDENWKVWCIRFIIGEAPVPLLDPVYLRELQRLVTEEGEWVAEESEQALTHWQTK